MKTTDLLSSAARNTFRSKTRTFLTVLSLFIGAFTLTITTALGAGVSQYVTKQVESLGAENVLIVQRSAAATGDGPQKYDPDALTSAGRGGPFGESGGNLSDADLVKLGKVAGVTQVTPIQAVVIDYIAAGNSEKYKLTVNPASSITRADLAAGAQITQDAGDKQLMLPQDYLTPLGFADAKAAIGAQVTLGITDIKATKHTVTATVVGVARTSLFATGAGANTALTNELVKLQRAGLEKATGYQVAVAYVATGTTTAQFDVIKADLTKQGFTGRTTADQLGIANTVINGIVGVLNAFAFIALLAAAFGIINTLFMSVQERTREIGLMKAMGMSSRKVFALFSFEAIFIGFLGSAIGAGVGAIVAAIINQVVGSGPLAGLPGLTLLLVQPQAVAIVMASIMLIAFLAGVLPARRAAKQNPIDALRYE